jgi:hypothetical protein
VIQAAGQERYAMNSLLRAYAREQAIQHEEENCPGRAEVLDHPDIAGTERHWARPIRVAPSV